MVQSMMSHNITPIDCGRYALEINKSLKPCTTKEGLKIFSKIWIGHVPSLAYLNV